MEDVHVVHLQSREALIDAPRHPLGAEIKSIDVAAALGGNDDLVPAHPKLLQAVPQHRLRDGPPVKPTKKRSKMTERRDLSWKNQAKAGALKSFI